MRHYGIMAFAVGATTNAFFCAPAFADLPLPEGVTGELSANVGVFTDYSFRGISQTNRRGALQGGLDYRTPPGEDVNLYMGFWASNVDFNDSDEADVETDYYVGGDYHTGNFTYSAGAIYYGYPGASRDVDYDYIEMQGSLGYDLPRASVKASFNYSPEYFGGSGHAEYYRVGASVPLTFLSVEGFSADGHIGRQNIADAPSYAEWALGLGYEWKEYLFKLEYVDTDLSKAECGSGTLCAPRLVGSAVRTF
ncbi:MAG: TorF family putative porin [Rickettsiales bacterium]